MTVYTSDQQNLILNHIRQNNTSQVYLLFGERFLCQLAAEKICQVLMESGGTIHPIDGDQETLTTTLNKLSSYSLFPGRQIYRVTDTKLFHTIKVAESFWKKTVRAWHNNEAAQASRHLRNMLETADLDPTDPQSNPDTFSPQQWKKLFGFAKPQDDLTWISAILTQRDGQDQNQKHLRSDDPATILEKTLNAGLPGQNILILTAEDVDKRKRLYKYLAEKYVVLDLSVEPGSSSRAQASQKKVLLDLLYKTLKEFDKTITREAADLLCERVGFHPVAVVMESEKLALYTASANQIDTEDLNAIVGRTRQEALFELTDALGKRELERALLIAERLEEHGIHPLAVIATLKNYVRNLLLVKALQEQPENGYSQSMSPSVFQQQIIPRLRQKGRWKQELAGHPFALFMQFKTAAGFSLATLKNWLEQILKADLRLKGSRVEPQTVVQHLIISMLAQVDNVILQNNL